MNCLTVGTVAVAAGTVVELYTPTILTLAYIIAKRTGFTVHNGTSGFFLDGERLVGVQVILPSISKGLLDFIFIMHAIHLPVCPGG